MKQNAVRLIGQDSSLWFFSSALLLNNLDVTLLDAVLGHQRLGDLDCKIALHKSASLVADDWQANFFENALATGGNLVPL
jgi:hypothetical protein